MSTTEVDFYISSLDVDGSLLGARLKRFVSELRNRWADRPFVWSASFTPGTPTIDLPRSGSVLALSPHPDDFEGVAVTCGLLREAGCRLSCAVVTLSPGGVDDEDVDVAAGDDRREV